MYTIASNLICNLKCLVIEEQAVLILFCNNTIPMGGYRCSVSVLCAHCGSGDGDGFLPLSRVQFKLIRGLMVGVGFYVALASK